MSQSSSSRVAGSPEMIAKYSSAERPGAIPVRSSGSSLAIGAAVEDLPRR